jgi:F0F1-type ATP synthase membrane subunit b/b'
MVDISDLPKPVKTDISDLPTPKGKGFQESEVPVVEEVKVEQPKPPRKTLLDKGKDVLGAMGAGGVVGYAMPEILTGAAMVAPAVPGGAAVAPFLLAGGQLARSARLRGAAAGTISGGGAELAGKLVPGGEKVVAEIPGVQVTRKNVAETVGGFLGPGAFTTATTLMQAPTGIKTMLAGAKKLIGGESEFVEAATRELANFRNKIPLNQFLESDRLRVSKTDTDAYRQVFDTLKNADQKIQAEVSENITKAQSQANQVLADYRTRAEKALLVSRDEAKRIRDEGDTRAKSIIDASVVEAQRKLGISGRAKAAGEQATVQARDSLSQIGDLNVPLSNIGSVLQNRVVQVVSDEQKAINEAYQTAKTRVDDLVRGKEAQGVGIQSTPAFTELKDFLNKQLVRGKPGKDVKFAPVTETQLKGTYENILKSIDDQVIFEGIDAQTGQAISRKVPTAFEAMDHIRRRLGEVFNGKEVAGFKGLQKQQAADLYDKIRKAQVEYAGGKDGEFDSLLKNYAESSELLNALKIPAGKKLIKTDQINPEYLTYDPSGLPGEFFSSEKKVRDLLNLTRDPNLVEKAASDFVARTLRDSNAKQVEKFAFDNKEWLDLFPNLSGRVNNHLAAVSRAESVVPKTTALAQGLKTEMKALPGAAQTASDKARSDAEKAANAALVEGQKSAKQITKEGEQKAKELMGAAGKLRQLGMTGDPVKEIEKIILGGQTERLNQLAPLIRADKDVLAAFNEAINTTLSRAAPGTVGDNWNRLIKPALENNQLITPARSKQISDRIRVVEMTLEPTTAAQTARWIIKTSLTTAAGAVAGD